MIQQSDSRKWCRLANQSQLWSVWGLWSLSALFQFLGGAWLRCDGSREPTGDNPYANPLYAPQTWKHELGLKGVLEAYVGQKHMLFGTAGNGWRQGLCSETASFRQISEVKLSVIIYFISSSSFFLQWFNFFSRHLICFSCPPVWLRLCPGSTQFWINHES